MSRRRTLARRSLGPFFVVAGAMHFLKPDAYERIVPPYVPRAGDAVRLSGLAEIVGGVAAQVPALRRPARWWLIAVLAGVFPANVHMAVRPEDVPGLEIPRWLLWARLPLQGAFAAWVWRGTR